MGDTLPSARNPDLDQVRDQPEEDRGPDTLRTCEACGGEGCPWCRDGFQDLDQNRHWAKFRSRMKTISNTYSLVESIILDVLDRLQEDGSDEALDLALQGHKLFESWSKTNPANGGRDAVVEQMKDFNRQALDFLQGKM